MCIFPAAVCCWIGAKNISCKIVSTDDKMGTKTADSRLMNEKQQNMCIGVDGTSVKIFASEFLVVMGIMTKHCWSHFLVTHCG